MITQNIVMEIFRLNYAHLFSITDSADLCALMGIYKDYYIRDQLSNSMSSYNNNSLKL